MSLTNYADLLVGLNNWLSHSLFSGVYPDFITLFESTANRRLRVREMELTTILVPSTPTPITVTFARDNGSGQIRLAVTDTSTFTTGQEVNVAGINGTSEANGSWLITVVDGGHLDLQGSTFTNAYVSGGTVTAQAGFANLPSDYLMWRRATLTAAGGGSLTASVGTTPTRRELAYVHPSYFQAAFPSQPADVPSFFTIEGSVFKVMPLAGIPIEFDYYQKIPSLVANGSNWLMTKHPDIYLFGTMCEAEAFGVNDERMPTWKARRDELFEEILALDRKTRGPAYIRVFGPTP